MTKRDMMRPRSSRANILQSTRDPVQWIEGPVRERQREWWLLLLTRRITALPQNHYFFCKNVRLAGKQRSCFAFLSLILVLPLYVRCSLDGDSLMAKLNVPWWQTRTFLDDLKRIVNANDQEYISHAIDRMTKMPNISSHMSNDVELIVGHTLDGPMRDTKHRFDIINVCLF